MSYGGSRLLLFSDCFAVVSDLGQFEPIVVPREGVARLAIQPAFLDSCLWVFDEDGMAYDLRFVVRSKAVIRQALASSSWLELLQ